MVINAKEKIRKFLVNFSSLLTNLISQLVQFLPRYASEFRRC